MSAADLAALVTAITGLITAVIAVLAAWRAHNKLGQLYERVKMVYRPVKAQDRHPAGGSVDQA